MGGDSNELTTILANENVNESCIRASVYVSACANISRRKWSNFNFIFISDCEVYSKGKHFNLITSIPTESVNSVNYIYLAGVENLD